MTEVRWARLSGHERWQALAGLSIWISVVANVQAAVWPYVQGRSRSIWRLKALCACPAGSSFPSRRSVEQIRLAFAPVKRNSPEDHYPARPGEQTMEEDVNDAEVRQIRRL